MSVQDTVAQVRGKYGEKPSLDECGAICNEVAWIHRAEGFGVSRKESGTRAVRHDGTNIAVDVIMKTDGDAWDILVGAGEQAAPAFYPLGKITDPARGFVAPIAPKDAPPTPSPDPPPSQDELLRSIKILSDHVIGALEEIHLIRSDIAALTAAMSKLATRTYRGEARLLGTRVTFTMTPNP